MLLRCLVLAVIVLGLGACASLPNQNWLSTERAIEPVMRMDEVAIPEAGKVSYVSGEVLLAQYPSGGKFVPLTVGAAIRDKTMLNIGPQASLSIEFSSGGSIQFSAAPEARNVLFVAEPLNNSLKSGTPDGAP